VTMPSASVSARILRPVKRRRIGAAAVRSVALAISCLISYLLVTHALAHVYSLSTADDLLGGMWAVLATVFVYRDNQKQSWAAASSRITATSLSFALCLIYLLIFPFHPWGLAVVIGIGSLVLMLIGRPEDVVTAGITTAVVMVVAALSPHNAWEQPLLRVVDTIVGIGVGIGASWITTRLTFGRGV
jgi:uncharacterized membrane protein YgaE (UPF0421/DUF939 family)